MHEPTNHLIRPLNNGIEGDCEVAVPAEELLVVLEPPKEAVPMHIHDYSASLHGNLMERHPAISIQLSGVEPLDLLGRLFNSLLNCKRRSVILGQGKFGKLDLVDDLQLEVFVVPDTQLPGRARTKNQGGSNCTCY